MRSIIWPSYMYAILVIENRVRPAYKQFTTRLPWLAGHGQGLRITSAIILIADQSASADRSVTHNPAHKTFFSRKVHAKHADWSAKTSDRSAKNVRPVWVSRARAGDTLQHQTGLQSAFYRRLLRQTGLQSTRPVCGGLQTGLGMWTLGVRHHVRTTAQAS